MDPSEEDGSVTNPDDNLMTVSPVNDQKEEEKRAQRLKLYKATAAGDWNAAKRILDDNPESLSAPLTPSGDTILHLSSAISSVMFLRQLVDLMEQKGSSLRAVNDSNRNALHYAAQAGNTKAVMLLVERDPSLTQQLNKSGNTPLHAAARYGHEDTVRYLLPVSRRQDPSLFSTDAGVKILHALIMDDFYDLAMDVVEVNPGLATMASSKGYTALDMVARKPRAFPSGQRLTLSERLLYYVLKKLFVKKGNSPRRKDIENPELVARLEETGWEKYLPLFGTFKKFHTEALKHKQLLQLLKSLAEKTATSEQADAVFGSSVFLAAEAGIHEFVAEVIKVYPNVIFTSDEDDKNIFDFAVIHRQEKVFNLLFQLGSLKYFTMGFDNFHNTLLHYAAMLDPSTRIDKIPGAALQMQRELQWFQAVEQLVEPSYRVSRNDDYKVPETLFYESHKELVKEGEEWMKGTANSYTIVAALVVTVAFASAFTLPGGNNGENGLPIFLNDTWFMVFAIANTLALFSSATSLLMFLGILTSRYSQEDFLKALPMRLAIGQITLFFAIAAMLVAFAASVNIVLSHRVAWIIVPLALLASLPLSLFVFLQFPLLVDVVYSTFGPSIFRKHSNKMLI